jgi:hypothetical protein
MLTLALVGTTMVSAIAQVRQGVFGFQLNAIPKQYESSVGFLGGPGGLVVTAVFPNSPAEIAGIVPGDIIASFANRNGMGGNFLSGTDVLLSEEQYWRPGDSRLIYGRHGQGTPFQLLATIVDPSKIQTDCDPAAAKSELSASVASDHDRDYESEILHARRALNRYEACYYRDDTDGFKDLLKMADSFLLIGVGYKRSGQVPASNHFLNEARGLCRSLISIDHVPQDLASAAQVKIAAIEKDSPQLALDQGASMLFTTMPARKTHEAILPPGYGTSSGSTAPPDPSAPGFGGN